MPHRDDAGVDDREPLDLRALARHFVLLGLAARRVRVRRKSDGAEGTLALTSPPLRFSGFLPDPGQKFLSTRPESRA